jgi:hypothetical protein
MAGAATRLVVATLAVAAAAGCSSGGGAGPDDASPPAGRVTVPDVVGLDPARAVARLCDAGLTVGAVDVVARTPPARRRPGRVAVVGRVRTTNPAAGVVLPGGHFVDLGIAVPRDAAVALRTVCDPAAVPAPAQEGGRTSRQ